MMNKIREDIQDDLTYKIIGCAIKVHSTLGNGFQACLPESSSACRQEVIYQRCLAMKHKTGLGSAHKLWSQKLRGQTII
ncbi:MAG: hypothetical protein AAF843_00600 [Bacteroidota bacterium]